jgi:putative mRNA 3-end processing factor
VSFTELDDADITDNGAVLLGDNIVCDSHHSRPVRIVSHSHSDHLIQIHDSVKYCEKVIATPVTKGIICVLRGEKTADLVTSLELETPFEYEGERIVLYPACHIPGSAQVLLETTKNLKILYTGDFRYPEVQIRNADILVTEATYGSAECVRDFSGEVEPAFTELVKKSLKDNSVYIFGYYGKVQEAVSILNDYDISAPILVPEKIFRILNICRSHGLKVKNYYFSGSEEGLEMRRSRHIGVYHTGSAGKIGSGPIKIYLSGWQFDAPVKQTGKKEFRVALSDHSDFKQLLEYISRVNPSLVILDGYRARGASLFALEVNNRLGIRAVSRPR